MITLSDIYKKQGSEIVDKLFNSYVVVSEQIDGSRFLFQKRLDGSIIFYKKDGEEINYIDRTLMKFYEKAISFIECLPAEIKINLPDNWTFGFQYFPSLAPINITYDRLPLNNLILTDISIRNDSGNLIKVIHDTKILNDWAIKLNVERPPVIYSGLLNDYQKEQLTNFLKTNENDLAEIFKTQSFTRYMISILNPNMKASALMNSLDKTIEGIVFKFITSGKTDIVSAKVVDPIITFNLRSNEPKKERKSNDMYQIIMLDIIEFLERYDFSKYPLKNSSPDERYVELISEIFNDYVATNGHKYFGVNFELPDFATRPEFDVNVNMIKNPKTVDLVKNDHLRNLFKIMLSSFRRIRKNPTDILTQNIIETINDLVNKIQHIITNDIINNNIMDFESFMKMNSLKNNSMFEQEIFEGLNLKTTKRGNKLVNIFVGRFQPFTLGHAKVFKEIYDQNKLPVVVLIVRGSKTDVTRAPFDEDSQLMMFGAMQREYKFLESALVITNAGIDTIFNALRPAYEPVLWGTGTDRLSGYDKQIKRYSEELNAHPELDTYEIKRGDEDISATKVREALKIDDRETFVKMTPKSIHKYYKDLKNTIQSVLAENNIEVIPFDKFMESNKVNENENNELTDEDLEEV